MLIVLFNTTCSVIVLSFQDSYIQQTLYSLRYGVYFSFCNAQTPLTSNQTPNEEKTDDKGRQTPPTSLNSFRSTPLMSPIDVSVISLQDRMQQRPGCSLSPSLAVACTCHTAAPPPPPPVSTPSSPRLHTHTPITPATGKLKGGQ